MHIRCLQKWHILRLYCLLTSLQVKVTQELKNTHTEQMTRLHFKHQTECDLLEDMRYVCMHTHNSSQKMIWLHTHTQAALHKRSLAGEVVLEKERNILLSFHPFFFFCGCFILFLFSLPCFVSSPLHVCAPVFLFHFTSVPFTSMCEYDRFPFWIWKLSDIQIPSEPLILCVGWRLSIYDSASVTPHRAATALSYPPFLIFTLYLPYFLELSFPTPPNHRLKLQLFENRLLCCLWVLEN